MEKALPDADIVATDVNPAVVQFAASKFDQGRVTIEQANAQDLPFENDRFDVVLCQFGVMFFPNKVLAHSEARRVLRAAGKYVLVIGVERLSDITDRDGARLLLERLAGAFPRLQHMWADMGYRGKVVEWIKAQMGWTVEIVHAPVEVGALSDRCRARADAGMDDTAAPVGCRAHVRVAGALPKNEQRL